MSRIPLITTPEELEPGARAIFDRIVQSRGALLRPFEALLHTPEMADTVATLGQVVKNGSHLADADREVITLATGRAHGCAFVWDSHLEAARAAGLGPRTISAIEAGGGDLEGHEAALVAFVNELCGVGAVSDPTFAAVNDLLGTRGVVELTVTVGYYTMLAYAMSAVEAC